MKSPLMLACVVAAVITLAGCEKASNPVGIVDLDKVASGIGEIERINKEAQDDLTRIKARLVAIQNNLNAQLKALQDKAGPDPDEAKQKELLASQQKARQLFNDEIQKARQAEQAVMKRRNDAFSALRAQIEPIAGQIARDKKISVVIVRSGAVLWWDDSVDLTEAVLDQVNSLRKAGSFTVATQPAE